jgi:metal-responsive CopG/Arc/MetJ family transcriptional regulator
MERISVHLTEKEVEYLRRESEDTGLSVSEIIRRAIDEYLGEHG